MTNPEAAQPSLNDILDAYAEIKRGNEQNGLEALELRKIQTAEVLLAESDPTARPRIGDAVESVAARVIDEAMLTARFNTIAHEGAFRAIGIKLDAPAQLLEEDTNEARPVSAEVVPFLEDPILYTEFLNSINPYNFDPLRDGELMRDVLDTMRSNIELVFDIQNNPDFDDDEKKHYYEYAESLFFAFKENLAPAYRALKLDDPDTYRGRENDFVWLEERAEMALGESEEL